MAGLTLTTSVHAASEQKTPPPSFTLQPGDSFSKQSIALAQFKQYPGWEESLAANGRLILKSLKSPCILIVLEDVPTLSLWVLKQRGEIPEGIVIYDFDGAFFQSLPGLGAASTYGTQEQLFRSREALERQLLLNSKEPVYSTARRDTHDLNGTRLVPSGLVYRFLKPGESEPDYVGIINQLYPAPADSHLPEFSSLLAVYHYMRGITAQCIPTYPGRRLARTELIASAQTGGYLRGIHTMLAERFLELGDLDNALKSAQTGVDKKPEYFKSHSVLGDVLFARQEWAAAMKAYQKSLQIYPDNSAIQKKLAVCKIRMNKLTPKVSF